MILLLLIPQQNPINPPLPEQIPIHFLSILPRGSRGGLVHPVDAVMLPRLPGVFLQPLQVLDLAFFIAFASELLDALALLEGFLLLRPHAFLVAQERGMP